MNESIRRALLAGVAAALITKEKAEKTLDAFVREGRINARDAKFMARRIARDGRKEFASVRRDVEKTVRELADRAGVEARTRIRELEAQVAELQKRAGTAGSRPKRSRRRDARA